MNHIRKVAFVIALIVTIVTVFEPCALAESLKMGSKGEDVKKVQSKLKRWGYYEDGIDGIFGSKTEEAVKKFQRANGLNADGVVGAQTATELGVSLSQGSSDQSTTASTTSGDVYLLARLIYGESRGEPYKGQVAVGAVVLNRVKSSQFPNSIAGVVYQRGAFSVVSDGQINLSPDQTAIKAAKDALNGSDPTNGCLYYYNPKKTSNAWMTSRPTALTIGEHVFCR